MAYTNALPLVRAFEDRRDVTVTLASPSSLGKPLADGGVDVAMVPVADLLYQPGLKIVSDCCIAAHGSVESVLLLLRRAPHRVRTLVLDPSSRSSQLLARICLRELHGVQPEIRESDPLKAWESGEGDAVLVIGDVALALYARSPPHLDLAAEWYRLTRLPFVFAMWAGYEATLADRQDLAALLEDARDAALADVPDLVETAAARSGLPGDVLQVYLTRRIRYRLAAPERAGLQTFLEMARPMARG